MPLENAPSIKTELLSIVEAGGYPNFEPLYKQVGFEVQVEKTIRRVLKRLKHTTPAVIVAEFNFQSDFRDRTSSLESLMAVVSRRAAIKTIIFYDRQHQHQFERLKKRFSFDYELVFPIDTVHLKLILKTLHD